MEQNTQRISLVNVAVLLAIGLAGAGVALYSHTLAGYVATVFLGLGFIVAAVSYFQTRLAAREAAERLEFEELARSTKASALFNPTDAEVFPARRAREQFERFLVPAFTVLLFLLQGTAAYFLGKSLFQIKEPAVLRQPLVAVALFGLFALVLFLLGKYSAAIARLEGNRLLRPASGYLLLGAYLSFGAAAAVAAVGAGSPRVDLYVARGLAILLGLIALETALNLLLEIYRPRVRGQDARLVYESRLVGLLGQPEGLITTAAQALDYQFGFKVSETWFYRFLERALGWLILAQLALLLISTSIVFVEPGEQALLERWGNPVAGREVLEPGLHLKWPWPMDRAFHHRTDQVQSFNVGFVADPKQEHAEKTILWTVPHYKEEFNLLVASREQPASTNVLEREPAVPVNLLTVSIPVQYQIKDLRAWAYTHTDAPRLLEHIATREVVRYLVSVDVFDIMSRGRPAAAAALRERIQATATNLGLGVEILFVGLQDVHPPVKVAPEYEKVVGALQEKEARIQNAEAYRAQVVPLARGEAQRKRHQAEAYRTNRLASQAAIITQFTNQLQAYRQSPAVFMNLAYLNALQTISTSRLYVLTITNVRDVINIDLHERVTPDMIEDVQVPR